MTFLTSPNSFFFQLLSQEPSNGLSSDPTVPLDRLAVIFRYGGCSLRGANTLQPPQQGVLAPLSPLPTAPVGAGTPAPFFFTFPPQK